MRQHTSVVVPFRRCEAYVEGVSRWLAWHAAALRTVHIRIEVRSSMLGRRSMQLCALCRADDSVPCRGRRKYVYRRSSSNIVQTLSKFGGRMQC